jgi:hypothetical protein
MICPKRYNNNLFLSLYLKKCLYGYNDYSLEETMSKKMNNLVLGILAFSIGIILQLSLILLIKQVDPLGTVTMLFLFSLILMVIGVISILAGALKK